jgi:hypothetical protein
VQVVRKFGAGVYRLITYHPKEENQPIGTTVPEISQSTSPKQPSNADFLSLLYRYIEKTTNKPTHHPVSTDKQENKKKSPPILRTNHNQTLSNQPNSEPKAPTTIPPETPQIEISPEISEKIKTAGFKLNTTLKAIVRVAAAQIIIDAIAAAQQYINTLQARNKPLHRQPEAVLAKAIQEQWKPQRGETGSNTLPSNFHEWFNLARSVDVVQASSTQTDLTQHPSGVLCVLTPSGWEPFDHVRAAYSFKRLQTMKEEREQMVRPPYQTSGL